MVRAQKETPENSGAGMPKGDSVSFSDSSSTIPEKQTSVRITRDEKQQELAKYCHTLGDWYLSQLPKEWLDDKPQKILLELVEEKTLQAKTGKPLPVHSDEQNQQIVNEALWLTAAGYHPNTYALIDSLRDTIWQRVTPVVSLPEMLKNLEQVRFYENYEPIDAWEENPGANIGLECGRTFDVIVLDSPELYPLAKHVNPFAVLAMATTPRGGFLIFVPKQPGSKTQLMTNPLGLDYLSDGMFIQVWPSFQNGYEIGLDYAGAYRWYGDIVPTPNQLTPGLRYLEGLKEPQGPAFLNGELQDLVISGHNPKRRTIWDYNGLGGTW